MRVLLFAAAVVLGQLTLAASTRAEDPASGPASILEVINEAGKKSTFTLEQIGKLPRKDLVAKDHRGQEAKYSGVLLADVLKEAGVTLGADLKGKLLANHLLVEAADNYQAAFSLPEVDPEWTDRAVLLATARNGEPLPATHGPFQLVISGEKRHSRWVKRIVRIAVRTAAP